MDQAFFSDPGPTIYRAGIGTLLGSGENFGIGAVPIINIDSLTTSVNLYYHQEGWVVAYFSSGQESSRIWQAGDLSIENPALTDLSLTTLLDAINEVLTQALNHPALAHDQLGYYHWDHPSATNFLMFAGDRGTIGSKFMSFAVPSNFVVHEVPTAMWISELDLPCARTVLDGVNITGDQCDRCFHYSTLGLTEFNTLSAHTLVLDHLNQNKGASGGFGNADLFGPLIGMSVDNYHQLNIPVHLTGLILLGMCLYLTLTPQEIARSAPNHQQPIHDLAITDVQAAVSFISRGEVVKCDITVANLGTSQETFEIKLHDETDGKEVDSVGVTVEPGQILDLTFSWDTSGPSAGVHSLEATAELVGDENPDNIGLGLASPITVILATILLETGAEAEYPMPPSEPA